MRYPIGSLIGEYTELFITEAYYPIVEKWFGKSIEQFADFTADGNALAFPYYEETLRLKKGLKI
jgi:hypothetical protein